MSIRDAELGDLMRIVRRIAREEGALFVQSNPEVRKAMRRCKQLECTEHEMELMIEAALEPSH